MNRSIYGRTAAGLIVLVLLSGLLVRPAQAADVVVFDSTISGGATAAASVSTSATVAATAGKLYLAAITTKSGSVSVRSIVGLGLAWTLVKAQCAARNQTRIELWQARGTPSQSGVVTANLSGTAANAAITVSRYSGVDAAAPVGAVVSVNTRGVAGSCSGGIDSNSYNVTLPASAPGAVVFGAVAMRNRTHAPGSGYVEREEISQGSGGDMAGRRERAIFDR